MATTVKDPVCGMEMDPNGAAGREDYESKSCYFCPAGCEGKFLASPGEYVSGQRGV